MCKVDYENVYTKFICYHAYNMQIQQHLSMNILLFGLVHRLECFLYGCKDNV